MWEMQVVIIQTAKISTMLRLGRIIAAGGLTRIGVTKQEMTAIMTTDVHTVLDGIMGFSIVGKGKESKTTKGLMVLQTATPSKTALNMKNNTIYKTH